MIVATCVATSPASSAAATGCCVTQARYLPDASAVKPARSLVKTDAGDAPVPRMDCVLLDMLNVLPVGHRQPARAIESGEKQCESRFGKAHRQADRTFQQRR